MDAYTFHSDRHQISKHTMYNVQYRYRILYGVNVS